MQNELSVMAKSIDEKTSKPIPKTTLKILSELAEHRYVYLTGAGGTGKSFNIELLKKHCPNTVVLATTGISAINVKGETFHSFLCIDLHESLEELKASDELNKFSYRFADMQANLSMIDLLIIDEVSMMNQAQLKMILYRIRHYDRIKVLFVGDFPQLPPVTGIPLYMSKVFTEKFIPLKLTKQRRQSADDVDFNKLLHGVRNSIPDKADWAFLSYLEKNKVSNAIKLRATNAKVREINESELAKLETPLKSCSRLITFRNKSIDKFVLDGILNNLREPNEFLYKIGARVLITKNIKSKGLCNGDLATIVGANGNDLKLHIDRTGYSVWVGMLDYSYSVTSKGSKVIALSYKALPLILGYSITIHKSQGLTLDKVDIDCEGIFETQMFYVALSRARSSTGVKLHNISSLDFRKNRKLKSKWYTK